MNIINNSNLFKILSIIIIVVAIIYYNTPKQITINGQSMGTTYKIIIWSNNKINKKPIQNKIKNTLININNQVSTWQKNSELSTFNRQKNTKWFKISPFFKDMLIKSQHIKQQSNGSFNIHIGKLIEIWGFDAKGTVIKKPNNKAIQKALLIVNKAGVEINNSKSYIRKVHPDTFINLSAIAKGGAIDEIAKLLEKIKINNFLIELGGEVKTSGYKIDGTKWTIGIEKPTMKNNNIKYVSKTITLTNEAIATSGSYKNYFEENGIRYSHIINPNNGRPIKHKIVSISVIHKNTAIADAWATALFATEKNALQLAEKNKLKAIFIIKTNKGFVYKTTKFFKVNK